MNDGAEEIRRLLAEEDAAWAAGDAAAFARAVAEDAVFTNILGQQFSGRAAFEAQHAAIFASIYAGSKLRQSIAHLRFISDEVAVVDTDIELSGARVLPPGYSSPDGVLRTKLLQVLVRTGEGWRVSAYHNVVVNPPPAA